MANKYNQNQVPDKSILDLNGRQAYMGNQYTISIPAQSVAANTETALVLIRMPAGLEKSVFLIRKNLSVSTGNEHCLLKVYHTPTFSVAGTPQTPVNVRPGSGQVSQALITTLPTVSVNGTLMECFRASDGSAISTHQMQVADSGGSLLISVTPSANPTVIDLTITWNEV